MERGVKNTKYFKIQTPYDTEYIPGCKQCDEIVDLKFTKYKQIQGNSLQNLCVCKQCNEYVILDNDKYDNLDWYLNTHKKLDFLDIIDD